MLRRCLTALAAVLALSACTADPAPPSSAPSASAVRAPASSRPNIVMVLVDDLSMNLLPFLPQVRKLQQEGTSFGQYTVTDSLCCPSRATIFSGMYAHNTGVFTNGPKEGGNKVFVRNGIDRTTFATDLQRAGYRTAMLGKYLNAYYPERGKEVVPPGWTEWYVAGSSYSQYNYSLLENGVVKRYGNRPEDYLTTVISGKAQSFITRSAAAKQPFLVEVATFSPHLPYTPAPQDVHAFPGLKLPRTKAYNAKPQGAPHWVSKLKPLTAAQQATMDAAFRKRAQSIQSVDRMIADLRATLDRAGVAENTVVVFTSDNGLHMGEYRLNQGKQTAYETDIHVPLVVAGPGVRRGATVALPAQNVDLRPTFDELAGVAVPAEVDGRSLVPLLRGERPADWRTTALVEHHGPNAEIGDPDRALPRGGNPVTYNALRTPTFTYVKYADGFREYYDRARDPYQLRNIALTLKPERTAALDRALAAYATCKGAACHTADRPALP
ncbi:sulfatase family protein [Actinoplanes sp. RD1]|uniref:sulfatase family protein n=1 Tax=Actinoplanes sp. RD1 TaxID=3064538 RepID=UPI002741B0AD|nr:sulfatase [Actinoplanes sp. RD1]